MITITYTASDADVAKRIQADLAQADIAEARRHILLVIVSPDAKKDEDVHRALDDALHKHHHIVPVLVAQTQLPAKLAHFDALDFTDRYDFDKLRARLASIVASEPDIRRNNRLTAFALFVIVIAIFLLAILFIGGADIEAPQDEYNAIATDEQRTIEALINVNLPRSTEEAANFPATVDAAPTAQRPLLIQTATALVDGERE